MVFKGRHILYFMGGVVLLLFIMYHAEWTVTGQVIDADTGEPIEGAVVAIDWWQHKLGLPGFPVSQQLDVGEDISDSQGRFRIPKYCTSFGRDLIMAVYKRGYVCWSSDKIFPPYAERYGLKLYENRRDFIPENGMQIRLVPFRREYSEEDHAMFVTAMMPTAPVPLYSKAIEAERRLSGEATRRKSVK